MEPTKPTPKLKQGSLLGFVKLVAREDSVALKPTPRSDSSDLSNSDAESSGDDDNEAAEAALAALAARAGRALRSRPAKA